MPIIVQDENAVFHKYYKEYFLREKQLDSLSAEYYYIMCDIMGEMGNSFNFKSPFL